jgi:phenylacetate-coenzyme A ligase PaaK-like adenylate-forming protein
MSIYFNAVDHHQLQRDFPFADAFVPTFTALSHDALRAQQEARFQQLMQRVWQMPFYQRLYGQHGTEPGDIRGLEDLSTLPTFAKSDLIASIEALPPYGDFHGVAPGDQQRLILHTTSGTTGTPQVLLFGPKSREIQNLLLARAYLFQGLRSDDVVHSVSGFGLELLDVDTGQAVPDGAPGDMVVTVLFKDDVSPLVRFNTHDVSAFETSSSPLGLCLRRIRGFLGHSDNMVSSYAASTSSLTLLVPCYPSAPSLPVSSSVGWSVMRAAGIS